MKAPDTIYIPIIEEDGKKLLCTNWWETDSRSRYVNETIPYIRKEVLLEWAKKQKEDEMANFPYMLDMLIDKLNSM